MKKTMIALLCAGQSMAALEPAVAAELHSDRSGASAQMGSFAGARLRMPLGATEGRKLRAGLAVAPMLRNQRADGEVRTRLGEGVELAFGGGSKARFALGGQSLSRLTQSGSSPDGRKLGLSTAGWLGIGVGVIVLTVGGLYIWADSSCSDCD